MWTPFPSKNRILVQGSEWNPGRAQGWGAKTSPPSMELFLGSVLLCLALNVACRCRENGLTGRHRGSELEASAHLQRRRRTSPITLGRPLRSLRVARLIRLILSAVTGDRLTQTYTGAGWTGLSRHWGRTAFCSSYSSFSVSHLNLRTSGKGDTMTTGLPVRWTASRKCPGRVAAGQGGRAEDNRVSPHASRRRRQHNHHGLALDAQPSRGEPSCRAHPTAVRTCQTLQFPPTFLISHPPSSHLQNNMVAALVIHQEVSHRDRTYIGERTSSHQEKQTYQAAL